jgi:diadenosine tetraphosphate (Ap4A) HIT family hydrolase
MVFHLGMEFQLHPRLAAGGFELGRVDGCRVLLKDQASFPWILIVPEVAEGVEDLHQLDERRYAEVTGLIRRVSLFVSNHFRPEKLNVGCIGNMVRQMHIHVVGRSSDDPAWPGTVWAYEGKSAYAPEAVEAIRAAARVALGLE